MASLKFPDTGTRYVEFPSGKPAADQVGYLYADQALTAVAEAYADADGAKGELLPIDDSGRRYIQTDSHGRQADYWGPVSGQDRLWIVINGVANPVDADYNARIDAVDARVVSLESGSSGGIVPATRTIGTSAPLTGGGDLSVNRTLGVSNATTGTTGVVQLAGDLTGTANAPAIASGAITSAKIADGTIVDADISGSAAITQAKIAGLVAALGSKVADGELVISGARFSVDPTGVADSTAAIQAAIDSAPTDAAGFTFLTDRRGAIIDLPPGRIRVTGQITLRPGVTLRGRGQQSTVLVNEGTSNHVLYFLGNDGGTIDCLGVEDLAIAQKQGVTHTTGDAIHIDGGGFGCAVNIERVTTYGTYRGQYLRDTYLSKISRCEGYLHATNAFLADSLCTSINYEACYAGANSGSGFRIFGNYMTLTGCGSDSNTLDGYEIYYNSGSAVSIALVGCGSEGSVRNGISCDRASGVTIASPRLIAPNASVQSGIKLDGGSSIVITAPVISSLQANSAAAVSLVNTSGAYPVGTTIIAMSQATNYASLTDVPDRIFHVTDQTGMGLNNKGFRVGPMTSFTADLQSMFIGNAPVGSGAVAYGLHARPQASGTITTFACLKSQPEVMTAGITRVLGLWASSPINTGASPARAEGVRIDDITGGFTSNANLGIGSTVAASGTWSIYNVSTRDNLMGGKIIMGSTTGPQIITGTGTPEGVVTAPVGSLFMRSDGGAGTALYAKETGTGSAGWVAK